MSETGHTPGPWTIAPECFRGGIYCEPTIDAGTEDGEPRTVATIRVGLAGTDANARLIAAAPALLEALSALADDYEAILGDGIELAPPPLLVAARAAISLAEGK